MNRVLRHCLSRFLFPVYRLVDRLAWSPPPEAFRIACLHNVLKSQGAMFERLLQYLLDRHGIITPEEAQSRLQGKARPGDSGKTPYLLTFDDGYKAQATLVAPILNKYGVKAIFFICPGLMDLPFDRQREAIASYIFDSNCQPEDINDDLNMMSWSDAESLIRSGHTIGSHSLFHRRLPGLSEPDLVGEIATAAGLIETRLGISVKWFAPPFGDLKSIDSHSLQAIGRQFQFSCTTIRGWNSAATRPLALLREAIDLQNTFYYQEMVLAGGLDFLYRRQVRKLAEMVAGI